jgi:hypothetical protein
MLIPIDHLVESTFHLQLLLLPHLFTPQQRKLLLTTYQWAGS